MNAEASKPLLEAQTNALEKVKILEQSIQATADKQLREIDKQAE